MVSQDNNKYKLYIKYSDHSNSKNLIYYNDLYAYDTSGNECCYRFIFNDWESPQITNVQTQLSSDGYIISCEVTDDIGVDRVVFPTWTAYNGQDDMSTDWNNVKGTKNGNTYTFQVKKSLHNNEIGKYYTHIYAYDTSGRESVYPVTIDLYIDTEAPVIKDVKILNVNKTGYTLQCSVTDNKKVSKVLFPTWTANNAQDDLDTDWNTSNKYLGTISNSIATFKVNTSDHNNETGIYKTHIYAYDELGNSKCYPQIIVVDSGYTPLSTLYYNNHKYIFFSNSYNLNWEETKQYCEQVGGHLATITSKAENDILQLEASKLGSTYYFIGGSDKDVENNWKWITGEKFIYTNWESGEPNNKNNEDFLAFVKNGYWNDIKADQNAYFICETGYTSSTVTKSQNNYTVNIKAYNTTSCEIIVAGYKNGKLVDLKVNPYSESSSVVLNGNIDKIKVMLWQNLKGMKPISEAEVISVTQ